MVLTRSVVRHPTAAAVTMITLAAGTAVAAVIFTVAWSLLFQPLPYADAGRLVMIWASGAEAKLPKLEMTWQEFEAVRNQSRTLEGAAAFLAVNFTVVMKDGEHPFQLRTNPVTRDYLRTLGVRPSYGRLFTDAEHQKGAAIVAVLTWDAWKQHFGGDRNVIGRKLDAGPFEVTVVGILPPHIDLPRGAESLVPMEAVRRENESANRVLGMIARRREAATEEQVASELRMLSERRQRPHPGPGQGAIVFEAHRLADEILGGTRDVVRILFGMSLLVLVIALLNVAAIALVRGTTAAGEAGVRAAVGATRTRIAMRRFTESLFLTTASCLAGALAAALALEALLRLAPRTIPRIGEVDFGLPTFSFTLGIAVLAAAISGTVQTFCVSERTMMASLRAASKTSSARATRRVLELLAAAQIAVAVVTIAVASLLVQSYRRLAAIDVGFSTDRVLTFHIPLSYSMGSDPEATRAFFQDLLARLRGIPGVRAAGSVLMRPLEIEQGWDFDFTAEGQDASQQRNKPTANLLSATPGYFEAMGIATRHGRVFTDRDTPGSLRVAVVSESFARRYWGTTAAAVGKRLQPGRTRSGAGWVTVIGVVNDVRSRGLTTEKLDIYLPFTQTRWSPNYFAIRTTAAPETVIPFVVATVAQVDKDLPVVAVRTTRELVDAKLAEPKLSALIVMVFAGAASFLALVGLYGVIAYIVNARTRELGIRIAVGADGGEILRLVLRRAGAIALAGASAGILLSIFSDRVWRSFTWGGSGLDIPLVATFAAAFGVIALMASLLPALRAARIEPIQALRAE